jgi:hypothetical protein
MKHQNEFNSEEESRTEQQLTQNATQEFSSVEELLRYDAARTQAPSGIAERLQKSSAGLPKPARSWWQKLFQR